MGLRRFLKTRSTDNNHADIALTEADVYDVLAAKRRRQLLLVLDDRDDSEIPLAEAARTIATQEEETPPSELPAEAYERVYVSLYQAHLPKLDRLGAVEWQENNGLICSAPSVSGLASVIREIEHHIHENG